jgi:hypothetical protein
MLSSDCRLPVIIGSWLLHACHKRWSPRFVLLGDHRDVALSVKQHGQQLGCAFPPPAKLLDEEQDFCCELATVPGPSPVISASFFFASETSELQDWCEKRVSALGQKRTSKRGLGMSASVLAADMPGAGIDVRKVPQADIRRSCCPRAPYTSRKRRMSSRHPSTKLSRSGSPPSS